MRLYLIIFVITIFGCGYNEEVLDDESSQNKHTTNIDTFKNINNIGELGNIWICNHPGTKHHNTLCVEEQYPNGCFVEGDNSKFCWLLTGDACAQERSDNPEWENFCDIIND